MNTLLSFIKYVFPLIVIIFFLIFKFSTGALLLLFYIIYVFLMKRTSFYTIAGRIKYSNGDLQSAYMWYSRAYSTGNLKPHGIIAFSYISLKLGNLERAEKLLKDLNTRKLDENTAMLVKSNFALVEWKKGNIDQAAELLESIYKDYKTTALYGSLGYLLLVKGDLERALELNLEAYEFNAENPVILDNLGLTYYKLKEFEKAEEIYRKLMAMNPSFAEAYYNFGLVLSETGKEEEALDITKKALKFELSFVSTINKEEIEARVKELSAE